MLKRIKYITQYAVYVAHNLILETFYLFDSYGALQPGAVCLSTSRGGGGGMNALRFTAAYSTVLNQSPAFLCK